MVIFTILDFFSFVSVNISNPNFVNYEIVDMKDEIWNV